MNSNTNSHVDDSPLRVPRWIVRSMIEHAKREVPRECCGLLGGTRRLVCSIYPLVNEAEDDRRYLAAHGLFAPMKQIREKGEQLLGIYHSHPSTEAIPSRVDMARNNYRRVPQFIVSLASPEPVVRAYLVGEEKFAEVAWEIIHVEGETAATAEVASGEDGIGERNGAGKPIDAGLAYVVSRWPELSRGTQEEIVRIVTGERLSGD
ncbi:M67 family metallopeptidase [Kolteria novifilia]|uniref:M67 family metallopeptidase n=1 Tax=Kolteria novifilia TaxID=2527975 RepID=UPI003AF3731D